MLEGHRGCFISRSAETRSAAQACVLMETENQCQVPALHAGAVLVLMAWCPPPKPDLSAGAYLAGRISAHGGLEMRLFHSRSRARAAVHSDMQPASSWAQQKAALGAPPPLKSKSKRLLVCCCYLRGTFAALERIHFCICSFWTLFLSVKQTLQPSSQGTTGAAISFFSPVWTD